MNKSDSISGQLWSSLLDKLKEALTSVLPVSAIVLALYLLPWVEISNRELVLFFIATLMLVIGIGLFNLGADLAMTPMGQYIGEGLTKSKRTTVLVSVCLLMGVLITVAEPDLSVLAGQVSAVMNSKMLIYTVGIGVGLLLVLGVNTGLRISDLVQLKVKDVRGREDFSVVEGKTDKERQIHLKRNVSQVITQQLRDRDPEEFVLQSRQPDMATGQRRGISRQRAYEIVKTIAREAGYEHHVGCHTMRKTYAWSMYDASGENLTLVQKTLNHSSQAMTMHYIGLDQREINETVNRMRNMV